MPSNALISMFRNRLNDLKSSLTSINNVLKAARDAKAEGDFPTIDKHIGDGITSSAAALMTLNALADLVPFIEGLTAIPTPTVPPVETPTPSPSKPPVIRFSSTDDSDVYG